MKLKPSEVILPPTSETCLRKLAEKLSTTIVLLTVAAPEIPLAEAAMFSRNVQLLISIVPATFRTPPPSAEPPLPAPFSKKEMYLMSRVHDVFVYVAPPP